MARQDKLFEEAPLTELPTAKNMLMQLAEIAVGGMKDADRIAAIRLYLEKIEGVIDDGTDDGKLEMIFTVVHKNEDQH